MVTFPPLVPSSLWFTNYLYAILKRNPEPIVYANVNLDSPKDFGRFHLLDSHNKDISLSLAIDRGGRQLRHFQNISDLKLSDHGNWRKNHIGAIEACLGRKPFFRHLEEPLTEVYMNKDLRTLRDFNTAIFCVIKSFLMGNLQPSDIELCFSSPLFKERGMEIAKKIESQVSVLQPLSEFGRESLAGILVLRK